MTSETWTKSRIEERVRALGPWFHNMNLGGVMTAPEHFLGDYPAIKWRRFAHALPSRLAGKSVLDVGCNAGFHALEMKRRGAARVVAIDSDERYLAQARLAAEVSGLPIELCRMSVYDVQRLEERFDIVLFMGALHHLRHPLLALDRIYDHVVGDTLVFQSMLRGSDAVDSLDDDYPLEERAIFGSEGFPRLHFVEGSYAGDWTNWWIPNRACAEAMLRSAGFDIVGRPEPEVFVCRKRPGGRDPEHEGAP